MIDNRTRTFERKQSKLEKQSENNKERNNKLKQFNEQENLPR
jgi:hypothetical protein